MSWGNSTRYSSARKLAEKEHFRNITSKNPVKILNKNNPEFLAIAAKCTKPKDIVIRHGMALPVYRDGNVDSDYRYRRGSEHTSI